MIKTIKSSQSVVINKCTYKNSNLLVLEARHELEKLMKEIKNIDICNVLKLASIPKILKDNSIQAIKQAQLELSNIAKELLANPNYRTSLYHNLDDKNGYKFITSTSIRTSIGEKIYNFSNKVKTLIF